MLDFNSKDSMFGSNALFSPIIKFLLPAILLVGLFTQMMPHNMWGNNYEDNRTIGEKVTDAIKPSYKKATTINTEQNVGLLVGSDLADKMEEEFGCGNTYYNNKKFYNAYADETFVKDDGSYIDEDTGYYIFMTQAVDMFTGGSSYDEVISTFPPISTKEDCIVERKNNSINSYSLIVDTDMASEISGKTIEDGWFMTNCLGSYYLIQVKDTNSKDYKNVLCEYFSTDSSITEEIKDYYLDLHHFKSY